MQYYRRIFRFVIFRYIHHTRAASSWKSVGCVGAGPTQCQNEDMFQKGDLNISELTICKSLMRHGLMACSRGSRSNTQEQATIMNEVCRVFGTLTYQYPHLILPYSVYYGHYGHWCSPMRCWCDNEHLQVPGPPVYKIMHSLPVTSVLNIRRLHTKPPHNRDQLGCQTRKSTGRPPSSRNPCLTANLVPAIYLTRGVPGGQITQYFGYYSC